MLISDKITPIVYDHQSLEDAFPATDAGISPLGNRVLVQIRTPKAKTKGGIILTDESRDEEMWNEMTAKVVALGPLAYCHRDTGKPWIESAWCNPGEYVRVPKWGGDRIMRGQLGDKDFGLFVVFNDHEIISKVTCNPLELKTYF